MVGNRQAAKTWKPSIWKEHKDQRSTYRLEKGIHSFQLFEEGKCRPNSQSGKCSFIVMWEQSISIQTTILNFLLVSCIKEMKSMPSCYFFWMTYCAAKTCRSFLYQPVHTYKLIFSLDADVTISWLTRIFILSTCKIRIWHTQDLLRCKGTPKKKYQKK